MDATRKVMKVEQDDTALYHHIDSDFNSFPHILKAGICPQDSPRRFAIVSMLVYDSIFVSSDECGSRELSDNLPYSYLKRSVSRSPLALIIQRFFQSWQA